MKGGVTVKIVLKSRYKVNRAKDVKASSTFMIRGTGIDKEA